jgi:hypothetical protein
MATEKQIQANIRNAARSTGPTSESGRSRSRLNSLKHGMACEALDVEAARSPEFEERRARWAAEQQPVGEAGNFALDRVVAATFRIEQCERAFDELITTTQQRAALAWDEDREVEAAAIFRRIDKDPVLASRQLQTTLAGVRMLINTWFALEEVLQAGRDWSESEAARALDLLGVATEPRSGRTMIDPFDGSDPIAFRQKLAQEEIERLEALRDEAMVPLDDLERRQAMAGASVLNSKPAKLLLRYERDAWKRYRESLKEVKAQAAPVEVAPPAPVVAPSVPASSKKEKPTIRNKAAIEDAPNRLETFEMVGEDAWLDQLDRRIEALPSGRPLVTERTQIAAFSVGKGD